MQNAKDTFYECMRGRLATVNNERVVSVRGVSRPALLVMENELPTMQLVPDCFLLRWSTVTTSMAASLPLSMMVAEFSYMTTGSDASGGMDRGRTLAAMDAELLQMTTAPMNTRKQSWAAVESSAAPVALSTRIWWGEPQFTEAKLQASTLSRTARVTVWNYEEAGEL